MSAIPFDRPADFSERLAARPPSARARWFVFRGERLLVELGPPSPRVSDDPRVPRRASWARLPDAPLLRKSNDILCIEESRALYLGDLGDTDCWAAEVPEASAAPAGLAFEGLRSLFSVLDDASFSLAGRAIQLLEWDRNHRYCGRCGAPTQPQTDERARRCTACGLSAYPRIAPAVMALVRRGRELLLARSPHFPPGMYSALAGFVEPGETLEQCIEREVAEEVGVRLSRMRYFASQPWPFPHSLMIAFVCDWAGGELRPQAGEIEAAEWFDVLQLPKLPSRISVARRLIDHVAGEMRGALGR